MNMAADTAAMEDSSAALAQAAACGDRSAFARLVETHYDFIFRMAWRWTGNREDAEDIAQEVAMRLGRNIRGYRGEAAFSTWLCSLTLNAVRDHARKAKRLKRLADAVAVHALVEAVEAVPADPAEALWGAVRELPERQRDAVLLVHGEGLSHAAAAATMNCSEGTVSFHIHEARKRLKAILRGNDDDA
jgi:RNA polymerase sigma-70 factor (ECF subfamily)